MPFGTPWGSENDTDMYKRSHLACVCQVSLLEGLLCRIFSETASKWHGRNRVWTAQARADRISAVFGKRRPLDSFLFDFNIVSGARRSHVVDFLFKKRSCLAGGFGLVVGVMELAANQPRPKSSQKSKSI